MLFFYVVVVLLINNILSCFKYYRFSIQNPIIYRLTNYNTKFYLTNQKLWGERKAFELIGLIDKESLLIDSLFQEQIDSKMFE